MRLGTITRDPVMTNVHTYAPKRYRWNWRLALRNLLIVLAIGAVLFILVTIGLAWLLSMTPQEVWRDLYYSMLIARG